MAYKNINEWLDEVEIFATRLERLLDSVQIRSYDALLWVRTAWDLGEKAALQRAIDAVAAEKNEFKVNGEGSQASAARLIEYKLKEMLENLEKTNDSTIRKD